MKDKLNRIKYCITLDALEYISNAYYDYKYHQDIDIIRADEALHTALAYIYLLDKFFPVSNGVHTVNIMSKAEWLTVNYKKHSAKHMLKLVISILKPLIKYGDLKEIDVEDATTIEEVYRSKNEK